jgi:hypothetical protein
MEGYRRVEDLTAFNNWTQSYRYKVLKLEKAGRFYLFKQARDDLTKALLKNEISWRKFFKDIAIDDVDCTTIVEIGDNYLLFDWIDAPLLAEPNSTSVKRLSNSLKRYVEILVAVHQTGANYKPEAGNGALPPGSGWAEPSPFKQQKLRDLVDDGWLTSQQINAAQDLYDTYLPYAKSGYQHGDFKPWHIFVQDQRWLIFDAEHATSLRSSYIDLVRSYIDIASKAQSPNLAARLLQTYLVKSAVKPVELQAQVTSALVRHTMGNVIDAYNDRRARDYRAAALNLLDRVLQDDLSALLQDRPDLRI